jgi:hypothetical protein
MSEKSSHAVWGCCSLRSGCGARAGGRPMALALYFGNARYALDWLFEEGRSLAPHSHSAAKQVVWGEPKPEEAAPGQMQHPYRHAPRG